MEQKKYQDYQKELADKNFKRIVNDLNNLRKQYQIFLDDDEVMKLKKELRCYKAQATRWNNAFFNLKRRVLKKWGNRYCALVNWRESGGKKPLFN